MCTYKLVRGIIRHSHVFCPFALPAWANIFKNRYAQRTCGYPQKDQRSKPSFFRICDATFIALFSAIVFAALPISSHPANPKMVCKTMINSDQDYDHGLAQVNFVRTHEWKLISEISKFSFQTHKIDSWESCTNLNNGII